MWTAVNQFSCRVASFDKMTFLTRHVVNVLTRHFHDICHADRRYVSVSFAYFDFDAVVL